MRYTIGMKRFAYLVLLLPIVLVGLVTKKNILETANVGDLYYIDKVYADNPNENANCVGSSCASCDGSGAS